MDHYLGIDLHAINSYTAIIDTANRRVFKKKTKNELNVKKIAPLKFSRLLSKNMKIRG